ncbi:MAG: hypothetical protein TREMPRED_006030, partial [Tremellales sp. Tagirdzhanova-0007]
MAASMEDLVATINGGMHVGQEGADLKDLHAKLAKTLHPIIPTHRPIPPQTTAIMSPNGPMPPPPPASSWNDGLPQVQQASPSGHWGNSPRQSGSIMVGKRETGFAVPPPRPGVQAQDAQKNGGPTGNQFEAGGIKGSANGGSMPYHASVLPVRAGPKET